MGHEADPRGLDRARDRLGLAYERARATGYRPDSRQMLDLHLAEQKYKHAQSARGHARRDPDPDTDRDGGGGDIYAGNLDAGPASRVIDLRGSMLGLARVRPAPDAPG